ncbi:response regulator transcription factor [Aurantiacibacter zhengii]|uniref:DNA-binding response regulator n=1 Tax=Aurantiacibacter zhengii TaxID=2307003 RepID=A0A418NU76_9SPHN|nr:response regulator transcription factor [Aurantiacibacter zhengii]RIV87702.1 DNA-binding response regulator [Aurantiacibacter zhengii]
MEQLSVLYIEDDEVIANATRDGAREHGVAIELAHTGEKGLHRAGSDEFDVIILDRMLPDLDGIEIVSRLRAAGVTVPVLMLSALGRAENRIEGLDAGVDDYMAKPFEPDELLARLRALHRRATNREASALILFGDFECHVKARTVHRAGHHIPLSPKEFNLFKYLIENAGEIVTKDMLLRNVWNLNFDPETNVIEVNINRLRRKLDEGFEKPCLETVRGMGYRLTA